MQRNVKPLRANARSAFHIEGSRLFFFEYKGETPMLKNILPVAYKRYSSLPILGSVLDKFTIFLNKLGYPSHVIRVHLKPIPKIEYCLKNLGCKSIKNITRIKLRSSVPLPRNTREAATIKLLEKFFDEQQILPPLPPPNLMEQKIINYKKYLNEMRSLSPSTIKNYCSSVLQFLVFIKKRRKFPKLYKLIQQDIEDFIHITGNRVGRSGLLSIISALRAFLHFLIIGREVSTGLIDQIDTPRIYRGEKLPRTLDWEIVLSLLKSVNRCTAIGKRDYAVLLLLSTYGLRASEIVDLTLDNINWRTNCLQVFQRKTRTSLMLPLTDAVGESILDYIQKGRPPVSCREIFVRHQVPLGILSHHTVSEIFQRWVRHSGLPILPQGAHCLRHSYALHLLRKGTSLKTIGDILGHRNFDSTRVYLRLDLEDLRTVPLSLPTLSTTLKALS